ncbi:MAG: zinc metallopeptidase [Pseudomonadota bacterium]|nr:zinc metallopeptidase [Pseudomonadota bacterium]
MAIILLASIILALVFLPNAWVKRVLEKYSLPDDRYSGTGAELAKYLLNKESIQGVVIEETEEGDHYDPIKKAVRLTKEKYQGKSLTAITVAAHEVGHAVQDNDNYAPLRYRTQLIKISRGIEKIGAGVLMISPFIGILTKAPGLSAIVFVSGLLTLLSSTLIHLITLPTEIDASFKRALPLLNENNILMDGDLKYARKILTAAAFTYVSASLMSLLNIARWWAILRR